MTVPDPLQSVDSSLGPFQAGKREQSRWLADYQVVVTQVLDSYGDGLIPHPLAPPPAHTGAPTPNT